jgi:hypothetical protein
MQLTLECRADGSEASTRKIWHRRHVELSQGRAGRRRRAEELLNRVAIDPISVTNSPLKTKLTRYR